MMPRYPHPASTMLLLMMTMMMMMMQQFYFGDGVHVRLKSCISLLHDRLLALPDAANVAIAFPDEGAYKR